MQLGAPGFANFLAGNNLGGLGYAAGRDGAGGGPMRRGGRQYGANARAGPYDRNNRNGRWGNEGGRLSPPPGGRRPGMASGGGRWGDGAAGGAAVGPREAVQGRSLKSYEDLDAVGGSGAGELPY